MKKVLCVLLALVMLLGLAACDDSAPASIAEPEPAAAKPAEEPIAEEFAEEAVPEVTYLVSLEDTDGYPVPGVKLQLCDDTVCVMGETDENGNAEFAARGVPCSVMILKAPEDYVFTDEKFSVPEEETVQRWREELQALCTVPVCL